MSFVYVFAWLIFNICEAIASDKHFTKNNATHVAISSIIYGFHELFRFLFGKSKLFFESGLNIGNESHNKFH